MLLRIVWKSYEFQYIKKENMAQFDYDEIRGIFNVSNNKHKSQYWIIRDFIWDWLIKYSIGILADEPYPIG